MSKDNKRMVLIVSFYFPPMNNIGASRIGKFAKYLPEFNWEPIVLTVDHIKGMTQALPVEIDEANIIRTHYFSFGDFIEQILTTNNTSSFPIQISKGRNVNLRSKFLKMIRLMRPIYTLPVIRRLLLDPTGWYPYAMKKGLEIINKYNINMIFSSYSPSTSHFVASCLHKRTGIPWVVEFRDLWTLNPYEKKTQPFYFIEQLIEKKALKNSSILISISEPLAKEMQAFHAKECVTIPNGFDEQDFVENISLTPKFTITHTGTIIPDKRNPTPLFKAIFELKLEDKISSRDIEVRFFGKNVDEIILPLVHRYDIEEFVKIESFIPYKESIKKQMESTALLLLSWNDPKDKGTLTGKVFEYMGAERPILALALKGGEIDNLLTKSGCGVIANQVDEIKAILVEWLKEFKQCGQITSFYNPDNRVIGQYTRKEQARGLAEVFNKVLASKVKFNL